MAIYTAILVERDAAGDGERDVCERSLSDLESFDLGLSSDDTREVSDGRTDETRVETPRNGNRTARTPTGGRP